MTVSGQRKPFHVQKKKKISVWSIFQNYLKVKVPDSHFKLLFPFQIFKKIIGGINTKAIGDG